MEKEREMKEVNKNFAQKNMTMLNKLSTDSVDFLPVVKRKILLNL
jgi:hypothetical protein